MSHRELLADYFAGLAQLPSLVRRIAFKRRDLDLQLSEASLRGTLRKSFGRWELLLFGVGIVIGSGVYSPNGTQAWTKAGPSVVVSYALAGLASLLTAAIYGEFVMEYPISGGGFTYTMLTLGELPAWLTGSNLVLSYIVGMAAVAKSLAVNISRLTDFNTSFVLEIGSEGGWQLDFFALGITALATIVLCIGAKEYAFLVSGASLLKLAVLLVIIIASFTKADPSNMEPFTLDDSAEGTFQAMGILIYGYVGYDAITNSAEEAQNPADLPPALLGTVLVALLAYIPLALSFSMLTQPCEVPTDPRMSTAPDSTDYCASGTLHAMPLPSRVFTLPDVAMPWLQYLIAVVSLLAVVAGLLVGLFSLARLVMVAARDWLLPPFLARVYPRTQTPVRAQCTVGVIVGFIGLLVPLDDLFILVSFGALFAMWMVSNAHLFRRYYPDVKLRYTKYGTVETAESMRRRMGWVPGTKLPLHLRKALVLVHMALLSGVSIGLAVFWQVSGGNAGTAGFLGGWLLATLSLQLLCPLEYQPAAGRWAVPWWAMPWLPSLTLVLVAFSIGSLDPQQMWRIAVWFAASLAFYLLFSLPMSYIKRRRLDYDATETLNVVELTLGSDGKWVASGMAPAASCCLGPASSLGLGSTQSAILSNSLQTQSMASAFHMARAHSAASTGSLGGGGGGGGGSVGGGAHAGSLHSTRSGSTGGSGLWVTGSFGSPTAAQRSTAGAAPARARAQQERQQRPRPGPKLSKILSNVEAEVDTSSSGGED